MDNADVAGDALAALYREKGRDRKLSYKWVQIGLQVRSGFIVMSQDKDSTVTLTGKGTVKVSGRCRSV